jgi:opacity protein-like surface antigen
VTGREGLGAWLAVAVAVSVALGSTVASAQSIRAGSMEFTLAGAGGTSLDVPRGDLETVTSVHLVPHIGYFLTDEVGESVLRGNFELIAEPALIHLDASESATVVGIAALGRWVFAASPRFRPYVEAGVGVLGGQVDLRQTNCDVNFILEAGIGAMLFVSEQLAVTLGARYHHISNSNICTKNQGLNSVIGVVGLTYFFR